MKLCQMTLLSVLVSIITTANSYTAETRKSWNIEPGKNGIRIHGKQDYPGDISGLVKDMLDNPFELLQSNRKLYGIGQFYERTDGVLARERNSHSCPRNDALTAIKKRTFAKLKSVSDLAIVFYDASRFFSELELLIHLHEEGIKVKRVVLIDPIFGNILTLAKKARFNFNDMLTLSNPYDRKPLIERLQTFLRLLSSMNQHTVEVFVYSYADLFARDMESQSWKYHMVVATDYVTEASEDRIASDTDLYGILMKHLNIGGYLVDFNIEALNILVKNRELGETPRCDALIYSDFSTRSKGTYTGCTAELKDIYYRLYPRDWRLDELAKSLKALNFDSTMLQLAKLQTRPHLLENAIELINDEGLPLIFNLIRIRDSTWPLWQILKASSQKNPKFKDIINYTQIIGNISRTPLDYALKSGNFGAAQALLHFGVSPHVQKPVFNFLTTMKRYDYLALLWLYGATEPVQFKSTFVQILSIIEHNPDFALAFAFELNRRQWDGQLDTLKVLGNEFIATYQPKIKKTGCPVGT